MNTGTSSVSFAAQGWGGPATIAGNDDRSERDSYATELHGRLDRAECEAQFSAAVLELIDKLAEADDLQGAGFRLVAELQDYFACQRVVLGICRRNEKACRLAALSGLGQ